MRNYGTFLSPTPPGLPPSQGRAWTRTVSIQSSDNGEEVTETRALLWEVIHIRQDLPSTARADANFIAAMVTVLALVAVVTLGGLSISGVKKTFVALIQDVFKSISSKH